jgi:hypothetical protein
MVYHAVRKTGRELSFITSATKFYEQQTPCEASGQINTKGNGPATGQVNAYPKNHRYFLQRLLANMETEKLSWKKT